MVNYKYQNKIHVLKFTFRYTLSTTNLQIVNFCNSKYIHETIRKTNIQIKHSILKNETQETIDDIRRKQNVLCKNWSQSMIKLKFTDFVKELQNVF